MESWFCSEEKLLCLEEMEPNPSQVIIWTDRTVLLWWSCYSTHVLDMLQNWFVPQQGKPSIKNDVWFQQNGALTHYTLAAKEYIREVFNDC
jgi:hypothetical protein